MTEGKKTRANDKAEKGSHIELNRDDKDPAADKGGTGPTTGDGQAEVGDPGEEELPVDLEEALEAARREAKDSYDRFLRKTAEVENFKKRSARELADFKKFANESLIKALLPVMDNLEMAIQSAAQDEQANGQVVEGVTLTLAELTKVLEGCGVKAVKAEGQLFDPKYHQAFVQEENTDLPVNTVTKEFQKGYLLHDRLIRPAMVIVSKKKDAAADAD